MRYLLLFIIIMPALEIGVLLFSGKTIGILYTVLLMIATGVLGVYLAKREGLSTIRKVQQQLENGQRPSDALLDGICVIIGGFLLIMPGFITDIIGILFLLPVTRKLLKPFIVKFLGKMFTRKNLTIIHHDQDW